MPPWPVLNKGRETMRNWSPLKTLWTLCALTLTACVLILTGCAGPNLSVPDDPQPMPAQWSEPQSPGAKDFSEKVRSYLSGVRDYFAETPRFMTPQSGQSNEPSACDR